MPTVTIAVHGAAPVKNIKCSFIRVQAGDTEHTLALHKSVGGDWTVTHPASGSAVIKRVLGYYRGVATTTKGYTNAEIKQLAIAQVQKTIERVTPERFNAALAAAPKL